MPTYRAYMIDGDDRVTSYKPIDAGTDAEALRAACQFADGVRCRTMIAKSGGLRSTSSRNKTMRFRKMKTPPASEDADGVFHAFTSFEVTALGKSNFQCRLSFQRPSKFPLIFFKVHCESPAWNRSFPATIESQSRCFGVSDGGVSHEKDTSNPGDGCHGCGNLRERAGASAPYRPRTGVRFGCRCSDGRSHR